MGCRQATADVLCTCAMYILYTSAMYILYTCLALLYLLPTHRLWVLHPKTTAPANTPALCAVFSSSEKTFFKHAQSLDHYTAIGPTEEVRLRSPAAYHVHQAARLLGTLSTHTPVQAKHATTESMHVNSIPLCLHMQAPEWVDLRRSQLEQLAVRMTRRGGRRFAVGSPDKDVLQLFKQVYTLPGNFKVRGRLLQPDRLMYRRTLAQRLIHATVRLGCADIALFVYS